MNQPRKSPARVRLGYLIYGRGLGGNGRYLQNLIERMDRNRYEIIVYLYCPPCDDCAQFEEKLTALECRIQRMTEEGLAESFRHCEDPARGGRRSNQRSRIASPLNTAARNDGGSAFSISNLISELKVAWYYLKLTRKIRKFFSAQNLDVLHFSLGTFPTLMHVVAGALGAGIRRVLMIVHITEASRPERWIDRHLTRKIVRSRIPVIALSKMMKAELIQRFHFPPEVVHVVYNGVDTQFYRPQAEPPVFLQSLNVALGQKLVLIPARLHYVKGHEYLFQAIASEKERFHNVRFLLAGEGPEKESLMKRAQELGVMEYVRFLGFRKDMRALIEASDLVALSSLNEGFPFVLLEAMSCAKPVVSTDAGAVEEMIEEGKTGYIVKRHDAKVLAEALLKMVESDPGKSAQMGQVARRRVVESFSIEQMVEKTAALYD